MAKRKQSRESLDRHAARIRELYREKKERGQCTQGKCRRKVKAGAAYCAKCLAWRNAVTKAAKRKARARAKS